MDACFTMISTTVVLACIFLHKGRSITCSNEYECASSNLTLNDTVISCKGFASCIYASTIQASSSFWATGSYSTYGVTNVISDGDSNCDGDSSCRNISHFQVNGWTDCYGYRSCFGSTFERINSTNSYEGIVFHGDESGAFTTLNLHQNSIIYAYARLSMYKSNVNMFESSSILAYGFAALNGANLYCHHGQTCTIDCSEYGCYNVSSISGNGTYSIYCADNKAPNLLCNDQSDEDDYNDIGIIALNDLPSFMTEFGFEEVNTLSTCKNSSVLGINCGNYDECSYDTLNYKNQAICCTSEFGCQYSSVTLTINISATFINYESAHMIDIYCGGWLSCHDSSYSNRTLNIQKINNNAYNNISQSFDIFCNGGYACEDAVISRADNLLCRAGRGCYSARIDSIKNVFVFGRYGVYDGAISHITENVYCVAIFSCYFVTFSEIYGNIYALSYRSLSNAIINNTLTNIITDKIYVIGYQSGYSITINNVKSIFASGYQALYQSIISGFRNLYVSGTDSLDLSILTTQHTNILDRSVVNSTATLYIDGTNSNSYNVTCSTGDECYIHCLSSTSCLNMILMCDGICYLNCGDYGYATGNDCPANIFGTWYPANLSHPSQLPTTYPTVDQSGTPHQHTSTLSSMTSHTVISTISDDGGSNSKDDSSSEVIILSITFCAVIVILIICVFVFHKKKDSNIQQKEIQLGGMINTRNNAQNNSNNNIMNEKPMAIAALRSTSMSREDGSEDFQASAGADFFDNNVENNIRKSDIIMDGTRGNEGPQGDTSDSDDIEELLNEHHNENNDGIEYN